MCSILFLLIYSLSVFETNFVNHFPPVERKGANVNCETQISRSLGRGSCIEIYRKMRKHENLELKSWACDLTSGNWPFYPNPSYLDKITLYSAARLHYSQLLIVFLCEWFLAAFGSVIILAHGHVVSICYLLNDDSCDGLLK